MLRDTLSLSLMVCAAVAFGHTHQVLVEDGPELHPPPQANANFQRKYLNPRGLTPLAAATLYQRKACVIKPRITGSRVL